MISKYKFCEKKHKPNKCWHLQAERHYCYKIGKIAKFCEKKTSPQASLRQVVKYTQSISCVLTPRQCKPFAPCIVDAKFSKSSVEKIIIDSGVTDYFFLNCVYFSKYEEYHHEFHTGSREKLAALEY